MKEHYLICDMSNILYRIFYANKQEPVDIINGLIHHSSLLTLNKYYRQYKPTKMVVVFDRTSWRVDYTSIQNQEQGNCITKKIYKGDRHKDMSPKEQEKYISFLQHIADFEDLMINNSTAISLLQDKLEADDLIAGFVDTHWDDKITIISRDADFIQLMDHPDLKLINPFTDKPLAIDEKYNNNIDFYMFCKCIRGGEDNIQSAFPGVRHTRLQKCFFENEFDMTNLLNETFEDINGNKYRVGDLFEENQLLMDLRKQPDDIKKKILLTIAKEKSREKEFSQFEFMKYCMEYELQKIADNMNYYTEMLSL